MSETRQVEWQRNDWLSIQDGLLIGVTALIFALLAGMPGIVGGVVLILAALVGSRLLTVGLAYLLLAVFLPAEPALWLLGLAALPIAGLLLRDVLTTATHTGTQIGSFALGGGFLVGALVLIEAIAQLWLAAGLLLMAGGFLSYGLHRYTLVSVEGRPHEQ